MTALRRVRKTPPELNSKAKLREIAEAYYPELYKRWLYYGEKAVETELTKLEIPCYRLALCEDPCPRCGGTRWHIYSPRNMKLQCERCRGFHFPRRKNLSPEQVAELLEKRALLTGHPSPLIKAPRPVALTCQARCIYQQAGGCTHGSPTIDAEGRCSSRLLAHGPRGTEQ